MTNHHRLKQRLRAKAAFGVENLDVGAPVVLHVPYTYFPDPPGGTEVYVRGLARELLPRGFRSIVAAPARSGSVYMQDGIPVHRFATDPRPRLDLAYNAPDEIATAGFARTVSEVAPAIVHLHAYTSAGSGRLVNIAHDAGAKVVLTYHTPTVSCTRGDMMLFGQTPCDGVVINRRCAQCTLQSNGVPEIFAQVATRIPDFLMAGLSKLTALPRPLSRLRVPGLLLAEHDRMRRLLSDVDHVVAVCDWVQDVLLRNGVPSEKLTLSRQGIPVVPGLSKRARKRAHDILAIAYFGRTDPSKGPDLLAQALALVPDAAVRLDIFAVPQSKVDRHFDRLRAFASKDKRIQIKSAIAPDAVQDAMRCYDLVAVPSRWLETGPLVVLEAFQAGVPVLGANRGGISELVRDGVDGVLVAPGEPKAWAAAIAALCADPAIIEMLRKGISPPRSIADAAEDMAQIYARLSAAPGPAVPISPLARQHPITPPMRGPDD